MANVFDVAKYILQQQGKISTMKLQKLIYYSQAWALVWDDNPLFENKIEAWANGPVIRDLYNLHKGKFHVTSSDIPNTKLSGNPLTDQQKESINIVLSAYGNKSPQWLSDQTHIETPWIAARVGLTDTERGEQEISLTSMANYYSSLK